MKALLIATLLGGIACGIFAFLLGMKHSGTKAELSSTQSELTTVRGQVQIAVTEKEEAVQAKEVAENNLTEAEKKVANLETELETVKAETTRLQTALNEAESARDQATTELADLKARMPDINPEQLEQVIQQQEEKVAALTEEKGILENQLQEKEEEMKKVASALERSKEGDLPPGISGRIAKVNQDWNFVVLDIGYKAGIVPNGELVVYRGNQMIGRVKVTSASPDTSVANILPEWQQAQIRPGDRVLNGTRVDKATL
ncbi:MAG: hypothetical protein AAGK14_12725 [Verrucomicrobiota bacterium]